jgi:ketosteroid isomerase-like protein
MRLLATAAAVALAACAHGPPSPPPAPPTTEGVAAADAAMAEAVVGGDAEAFGALLAPDAVFAGGTLHVGRDRVREGWRPYLEKGGPVLRWAPSAAGIAASGELGWTVGNFVHESAPAPGEKPVVAEGRYVTVWQRTADGTWVAALDMGLEPPTGAETDRTTLRTLRSRDGSLEATMGTWSGDGLPVRGAWLVLRERDPGGWRVVHESAIRLSRPPAAAP